MILTHAPDSYHAVLSFTKQKLYDFMRSDFFFLLLALRLKQLEFFFESPCLCLYFEVLPFQWILEFQVSGTFGVDFLQGESGKLDLFFYMWIQPFLSYLVHLKRLTFLQRM